MHIRGATCSRPSGLCDRTSTTFRFGLIAIVRATDLKRTNRVRTGNRWRTAPRHCVISTPSAPESRRERPIAGDVRSDRPHIGTARTASRHHRSRHHRTNRPIHPRTDCARIRHHHAVVQRSGAPFQRKGAAAGDSHYGKGSCKPSRLRKRQAPASRPHEGRTAPTAQAEPRQRHKPSLDLGQRQRSFGAHAMFSRT
jgi:hypothetical protein